MSTGDIIENIAIVTWVGLLLYSHIIETKKNDC
jgi:hypothetical protein